LEEALEDGAEVAEEGGGFGGDAVVDFGGVVAGEALVREGQQGFH